MRVEQRHWTTTSGWTSDPQRKLAEDAHLALVFGPRQILMDGVLPDLQRTFPRAVILGCSTAGEICGTSVHDNSLTATAVHFKSTRVVGTKSGIAHASDSHAVGRRLAESLDHERLRHVLVLSEGLNVNGTALVAGLTEHLPPEVGVTGGLSADGDRFEETCVVWEGAAEAHTVVGLGLYGEDLSVGYGSLGGWDPFGPERLITRSEGNVLYELDGRAALDLYRSYLGEHADELPASGLLFPLSLRVPGTAHAVVRTILAVDPPERSITFAGDMPEGVYARLMKANFERLINGASGAARVSCDALRGSQAELALLISCVGRKLLLKQRTEEEVEGVRDVLGTQAVLTGFYSYGEISPFTPNAACELHNQTMTITTFSER